MGGYDTVDGRNPAPPGMYIGVKTPFITQGKFQGPPLMGPPYGKLDPYYSHISRDSKMGVGLGNSMGPKGFHVLGGT